MKKQTALELINKLPAKFDVEELIERLIVIEKIDKGLEDVKQGKTASHKKAKETIKKWLK